MVWIQALAVVSFILVHLFAGKLRFLDGIPRSRWLSFAGGIAVAYVFLHVFPELAEAQELIGEASNLATFIEHHAYLIAVVGLAVFYGLERSVKTAQRQQGQAPDGGGGETTTGMPIFYLHITSFAIYNALIGYLLVHREEQDIQGLFFYSVAMGLHFLVNDFGLRQDHKETYRRIGRWILAGAVAVGWLVGLNTAISQAAVAVLFAFLAGGVILNVLKEELPDERQSRFLPFAIGTLVYAIILLLL